jgi:hypothetical protein
MVNRYFRRRMRRWIRRDSSNSGQRLVMDAARKKCEVHSGAKDRIAFRHATQLSPGPVSTAPIVSCVFLLLGLRPAVGKKLIAGIGRPTVCRNQRQWFI